MWINLFDRKEKNKFVFGLSRNSKFHSMNIKKKTDHSFSNFKKKNRPKND